jgi:AcrR family transcriptional regulator
MKKTDNKDNILEISLQLFSELGFDAVGIQLIVDRSEITKPTLYHYFGSKKGLLEAILKKYFGDLLDRLEKVAEYRGDLIKTLTDIVNEYFIYAEKYKSFFYLQLSLSFVPSSNETYAIILPYQQKLAHLLKEVFIQAAGQHGNLRGHQDILAVSLIGLLKHYTHGILNGTLNKTDDFVYKVVKQYMHGIYVL